MSKIKSLKKNQFRAVYKNGKSIADKRLVAYVLQNGSNENFLGISVSRKVGGSVQRNRLKRLIRESYRSFMQDMIPGFNIAFVVRTTARDSAFAEIRLSVLNLLERHALFHGLKLNLQTSEDLVLDEVSAESQNGKECFAETAGDASSATGDSGDISVFALAIIKCLRFYRRIVSPILPPACRFTPTCSEYTLEAVRRYGAAKGIFMGIKRVLRCNPFCKGGYDPVP